jgi:23S rRNA (cytosine1962-C5)-methyltransferase
LKKGREQSVLRRHPWIFSGGILQLEGEVMEGAWVEVCDHKKNTLCFGHYANGSIAVRILAFGPNQPDEHFWEMKIADAVALRRAAGLPSPPTNCYRLIHAEGDGLPGLIIDYYNGFAILQAHSAGMHNDRDQIASAVKTVLGNNLESVYYKSRSTLPAKIKDEQPDGYLSGKGKVPHTVREHNHQFLVDWEDGQKTGFFLDQRENRKLLGDFSHGKSVLNTFCYTGGFSVYALRAGASVVHSIDVSAKAIELTRRNIERNGFDAQQHTCTAIDTFDFLKGKQGVYDLIILDPPAFAKHRDARHQAVKGYQRLNAEAMKVIKPGGIIFTFSCSQAVDRQLFYDTVVSASIQAGKEAKVLHHLSQPADHPVSMYHPEGEYLKGLVLYIL